MEFLILDDGQTLHLPEEAVSIPAPGQIRISPTALEDHLGWTLKPEGLCQSKGQGKGQTKGQGIDRDVDLCVPVRNREALVREGQIDLASFAEVLGRPLAIDSDERIAALGTAAASQAAAMTSLKAPDFELPDLAGRMHTLSEHRGKKVLLIAYASW